MLIRTPGTSTSCSICILNVGTVPRNRRKKKENWGHEVWRLHLFSR